MKSIWLGLLFCLPVSAQPLSPAATELTELDFFYNGEGMHLSAGILNKLETLRNGINGTRADQSLLKILLHRWGIQEEQQKLVGIKTVPYQRLKVGVLGCVACHSGRAAGQYIVGIGNKNIDPGQIGMDGIKIETAYQKLTRLGPKSADRKRIEESSIRLMRKLADPTLSAATQGLVPVALVGSWFYEVEGLPLPKNGFKGATKVPSWFGFGKKLEVGQFADAIGQGHPPGWIVGVEIAAGQSAQGVRDYFARVEHASQLISELQPPPYPFVIHYERAARGKARFEQTCAHCHGTYESTSDGKPVYQAPRVIPWAAVGTDPDRLDYVTPDFLERVKASPLSDLIQLSQYAGKRMYVAPRLHAIWALFPYLHNGSVPTLRALLEPAAKRPRVFSLQDAGELNRFDPQQVGLNSARNDSELKALIRDQHRGERWIYDTSRPGQSNQGHEKYVDLPDSDKEDLVEYLKTL